MRYFFKNCYMLLTVLLLPFTAFVEPVERVDIYDNADNHLMFITFEYDNNGTNTARTIYMSDSTFVRRTVINGNKEYSLNFNGDTILTSKYEKSESATKLSVSDQFKLDMFGGAVNYSEKSTNNFEITQNGSLINKVSYGTSSGGKSRIDILNSSGEVQFYALAGSSSIIPKTIKRSTSAPSFKINSNRIRLQFTLSQPSIIDCELISLSGRRVAKLVSKKAAKGIQNETINISKNIPTLSGGVYFLTLSIDGKRVLNQKILMQNSGRVF